MYTVCPCSILNPLYFFTSFLLQWECSELSFNLSDTINQQRKYINTHMVPFTCTYKFRRHSHFPHSLDGLEKLLDVVRRNRNRGVSHGRPDLGDAHELGGPGVGAGDNSQAMLYGLVNDGVL